MFRPLPKPLPPLSSDEEPAEVEWSGAAADDDENDGADVRSPPELLLDPGVVAVVASTGSAS